MFATLRWTFGFVFAVALHAVAIGMLLAEGHSEEASRPPVPAILMELPPLPVDLEIVPEPESAETHDPPPPLADPEGTAPTMAEAAPTCDPQAAGPEAPTQTTLKEWQDVLQHHLDRYKRYPAEAQRKGQQGTPHIVFTMCRDGRVLEAHVLQTSGFTALDQAGMEMVRGAEPLPGFPQSQSGDTLSVVVPVEFSLRH
jgi:protein TonB